MLAVTPVSIHGARYVDVVLADADVPQDPESRLTARLGVEAVDDDLVPGDRVRIEGFLRVVTAIRKTATPS